jgi:quercetin dioxygenase-like cupin family protein
MVLGASVFLIYTCLVSKVLMQGKRSALTTAALSLAVWMLRGRGISGGEERHVAKGDFVRIPTGVPHWLRTIDGGEIVYLVVKITAPK